MLVMDQSKESCMICTVKKLATLSGVSVRTLHYYDEIGLLKPARHGENGYRYYEEEQLLMLQQILFFRELGFKLKDIQHIVSRNDFEKMSALVSHKETLKKNIARMRVLIHTIDKTIQYLKGEPRMKSSQITPEEFYEGFVSKRQKIYEQYFLQNSLVTESDIVNTREKVKNWTMDDWMKLQGISDDLHKAFVVAIQSKFGETSIYVQGLVRKHYDMTQLFLPLNKKSYIGLGELYCNNSALRQYFDAFDPALATYLASSMNVFAEQELATKEQPAHSVVPNKNTF